MNKIKILYSQLPKKHKIVLSSFSVILLLLLFIPSEKATASKQLTTDALQVGKRYQVELPGQANQNHSQVMTTTDSDAASAAEPTDMVLSEEEELLTQLEDSLSWRTATVKSGDSLAKILDRYGFSPKTTYQVSQVEDKAHRKQITSLNVGETLKLGTNSEQQLVAIIYPQSKTETLVVHWLNDKYQTFKQVKTVETRIAYAHGEIKSNFWNSGISAGLDDGQIINLANIFGWDIDFGLDIREGDHFSVVYENRYIDGEYIGAGDILAAEFVNQGDAYNAVRFTDGNYYTPDGRSLRKAFLRAPVNFRYISSNFKPRRFHPIQKRWKSHNGTDYRANTGTPVVAAGSGKVTHSTYNKYNGNYVFIQHGDGIETKYLHFSKRAVKKGQRVKQGQVIGYVGSTGMSEAPHLHYEFLVNGVHRNPRTVKLPDAKPIEKQYRQEFDQLSAQLMGELSNAKRTVVAMQ